jgi:hypothetical protein
MTDINTTYYLIGYQRSNFDYDRLFYDNIHYFLQEYKAWEKVYTNKKELQTYLIMRIL